MVAWDQRHAIRILGNRLPPLRIEQWHEIGAMADPH
jgi:hypothetical protein